MSASSDLPGRHAVGVIGLGQMGGRMARVLLRAGWDVTVSDPAGAGALVAEGATAAGDPRAVAERVGLVLLSLPGAAVVEEVVFGPRGLVAAGRQDLLVVDTTTMTPAESRSVATRLHALGAGYLDVPLSGGPEAAASGTLSVMVGGDTAELERARPLLSAIGSRVVHCGPSGAGSVAKACNQLIVVATLGAVAEALAIADASGVDVAAVREALLGGWAASPILERHGARMLRRDWEPGGKAVYNLKDIASIEALSAETGVRTPVFDAAGGHIRALVDAGGGDLDHSAVFTIVRGGPGDHPEQEPT